MAIRPRPLLAVRLIGRSDVAAAEKAYLIHHFNEVFGAEATCRVSTRAADRAGEIRVYLTVTRKEHQCLTPTNHDGASRK